jgi:hypothetical protein
LLGTVSDKPPFGNERALEELLDGVDLVECPLRAISGRSVSGASDPESTLDD